MKTFTRLLLAVGLGAIVAACGGNDDSTSPTYTGTVLHSFGAGTDGANPSARLVVAADGNFYGTTVNGGTAAAGTVFRLPPAGAVQAYYSFSGGSTGGANPEEALTQGTDGNFYGTTRNGGAYDKGVVFKINPAGVKTVMHEFGSSGDGANPLAALVQARDGFFYGTTYYGGSQGEGTVFRIGADGSYRVVYAFAGSTDGSNPAAGLVEGSDGNLYGTTYYGGGAADAGTVFRVTPAGVETVLHAFAGGADGAYADVGLVQGSDGNLYGVTAGGGEGGVGTVFKLTPAGTTTVLHAFAGGESGTRPTDPASPSSRLIQARDGHFYGTSFIGGANGVGTVYRISSAGAVTIVYSFGASQTDAVYPDSALVQGPDGFLYGTTEYGGEKGLGTVYRLSF